MFLTVNYPLSERLNRLMPYPALFSASNCDDSMGRFIFSSVSHALGIDVSISEQLSAEESK